MTADPALLTRGALTIEGQLVDASNSTLLCVSELDGERALCVYKPVAGERPLWDFPTGTLANRERATFLVSQATGWDLVPTTVLRDGPFGPGMVQVWVDVDERVDVVGLLRRKHPDLRRMTLLDAVVNNSDRKGGHLLPLPNGRVQGVDHGLTFAVENKLRTLLWQWEGEEFDGELRDVLQRVEHDLVGGSLGEQLGCLLSRHEVRATQRRVATLLRRGVFPSPSADWPAVPWPPF